MTSCGTVDRPLGPRSVMLPSGPGRPGLAIGGHSKYVSATRRFLETTSGTGLKVSDRGCDV